MQKKKTIPILDSNQSYNMSNVRHLGPIYLYNMLQDFRHLIIFDLRSQQNYNNIYIRDSFNVNQNTKTQQIYQVVQRGQTKATEKQIKYKQIKRVRRFFFIADKKINGTENKMQQILSVLEKNKSKDDKIYALDGDFNIFTLKYYFMCISKEKIDLMKKCETQHQADKILLYPYSKFPSEIIPDKLYLGNVYSSNSELQLNDLKINTLFDFIDYNEGEKIPSFKTQDSQNSKYTYIHLPFNNQVPAILDFDLINLQIDKKVSQAQGKILLYCKDGQVISPAFAISYLMYKTKIDINMATLKVCQAISRVQICKWIYTQLLVYKPKK